LVKTQEELACNMLMQDERMDDMIP